MCLPFRSSVSYVPKMIACFPALTLYSISAIPPPPIVSSGRYLLDLNTQVRRSSFWIYLLTYDSSPSPLQPCVYFLGCLSPDPSVKPLPRSARGALAGCHVVLIVGGIVLFLFTHTTGFHIMRNRPNPQTLNPLDHSLFVRIVIVYSYCMHSY